MVQRWGLESPDRHLAAGSCPEGSSRAGRGFGVSGSASVFMAEGVLWREDVGRHLIYFPGGADKVAKLGPKGGDRLLCRWIQFRLGSDLSNVWAGGLARFESHNVKKLCDERFKPPFGWPSNATYSNAATLQSYCFLVLQVHHSQGRSKLEDVPS